jgi:hypothetical protein
MYLQDCIQIFFFWLLGSIERASKAYSKILSDLWFATPMVEVLRVLMQS